MNERSDDIVSEDSALQPADLGALFAMIVVEGLLVDEDLGGGGLADLVVGDVLTPDPLQPALHNGVPALVLEPIVAVIGLEEEILLEEIEDRDAVLWGELKAELEDLGADLGVRAGAVWGTCLS